MDLAALTLDNVVLGMGGEPAAATVTANAILERQEDEEFSTCGYWSFSNST